MGAALLVSSARYGRNWSPILQVTWNKLCIFMYFYFFVSLTSFPCPCTLKSPPGTILQGPQNWVIPSVLGLLSVLLPQIPRLKCSAVTGWFLKSQIRPKNSVLRQTKVHLAQHIVSVSGQRRYAWRSISRKYTDSPNISQVSGDWWLKDFKFKVVSPYLVILSGFLLHKPPILLLNPLRKTQPFLLTFDSFYSFLHLDRISRLHPYNLTTAVQTPICPPQALGSIYTNKIILWII